MGHSSSPRTAADNGNTNAHGCKPRPDCATRSKRSREGHAKYTPPQTSTSQSTGSPSPATDSGMAGCIRALPKTQTPGMPLSSLAQTSQTGGILTAAYDYRDPGESASAAVGAAAPKPETPP